MRVARHDPLKCPQCSSKMDASGCLSSDKPISPSPGDFTICSYCQTVLRYGEGLRLSTISDQDIKGMNDEERAIFEYINVIAIYDHIHVIIAKPEEN